MNEGSWAIIQCHMTALDWDIINRVLTMTFPAVLKTFVSAACVSRRPLDLTPAFQMPMPLLLLLLYDFHATHTAVAVDGVVWRELRAWASHGKLELGAGLVGRICSGKVAGCPPHGPSSILQWSPTPPALLFSGSCLLPALSFPPQIPILL